VILCLQHAWFRTFNPRPSDRWQLIYDDLLLKFILHSKQIARQLHTQYVMPLLNLCLFSVTV